MIRYAIEQDKPRVRALWEQGFGDEEPYTGWYFARVYRSEHTLVYEEEGRLLSSLQLAPYLLNAKGRTVPAAYIVGVVTEEPYRVRGYANALLQRALSDLQQDGRELALLYTDIPGFYDPLGFTCCYRLRRLRFPAAEAGPQWEKRQPDKAAIAHCQDVYQRMCGSFDGYVLRTAGNWQTYLEDWLTDGRNGLYTSEGAYVLTDVSESGFGIKEIGYTDEDALQQALACCARLAADHGYAEFGWDAPESAPLPTQAGETLRPWVMARITGGLGLTAAEAAAATLELLSAPNPRLWVGEIT